MRTILIAMTALSAILAAAAGGSPAGSWTRISTDGEPGPRSAHSTVWTGSELVVWGGRAGDEWLDSGAAYDPAEDRWRTLPTKGAPTPRAWHRAAWTGTEMIVWGGSDQDRHLGDGAAWNPETNGWEALPLDGAPKGRVEHSAIWTGEEMIVWSGVTDERSFTGGAGYRPATRTWRTLEGPEIPFGRRAHAAVWTGREMIVWGGINGSYVLGDGFRYDPTTDSWSTMAGENAPSARGYPGAVWTGERLLIWGGRQDIHGRGGIGTGAAWDPETDTWTALPADGAPAARHDHAMLWIGKRLLVWGGAKIGPGPGETATGDGALFDPRAKRWSPLPASEGSPARVGPSAAWTGRAAIFWGGDAGDPIAGGLRFDP